MAKDAMNGTLILLVFCFFLLVNVASAGGHFDSWDGVQTFLVGESLVLKHSAKLYPDSPSIVKLFFNISRSNNYTGQYTGGILQPEYNARSLLVAAIVVPFYDAAMAFSVSPITVVALFVNSMIISLTSVIVFCFSLEIFGSKKIAFALSLIFNVCSFVWPYNDTLVPQPLEGLCIIASAFFIYLSAKRNNKRIFFAGLAGLFLGMSVLAHPSSIILIPGFIAYSIFMMRISKTSISCFLLSMTIILIFAGLTNYWRFGSLINFGYGSYGSLSAHQGWSGLIGVLISPGSGLIFYFPIAILAPLAFKNMYRDNKGLFFLFGYNILAFWLFVGTTSFAEPVSWNGAGAWGPRYLVPILAFITIVSGTLLRQSREQRNNDLFLRVSIIVLCFAGFYVNLAGKLIWYIYGYAYAIDVKGMTKYIQMGNFTEFSVSSWFPYYSPIALHIEALVSNYPSHINATHAFNASYWSYGNAPCSYDNYLICKFGLIPLFLLSGVIALLAFLIVIEIYQFSPILWLKRSNIKRYWR